MNENINLCEILRDCPKGTKLYSPLIGVVIFQHIGRVEPYQILTHTPDESGIDYNFTKEGKYYDNKGGECIIFPSKDQRDWGKWQCPKPKFDPSTLKPFDKVLVRGECKGSIWRCSLFSNYIDNSAYAYCTNSGSYKHCIPYNEETKHLVGKMEDAPEYYRYWEE